MSIIFNGTRLSKGKRQYFNGVELKEIYYQDNDHEKTLVWKYDVEPHNPALTTANVVPTSRGGYGWTTGIPSDTATGCNWYNERVYAYSWAWAGWGAGVGCGATAWYSGYIVLTELPDWEEITKVVVKKYLTGTETIYIQPGQTTVSFSDSGSGGWENSYFPTSDKSFSYGFNCGLSSFSYYYGD